MDFERDDVRFDPASERLAQASDFGSLIGRINETPGGPDVLAEAFARRERQVRMYRRRPRLYPLIARARNW